MILVVTTNGIFVIDTSLYHAPITFMLDGKVTTYQVNDMFAASFVPSPINSFIVWAVKSPALP